MANQFSVAIVDSILSLFAQGWSQRRIARELRIDRETVARHVRLRGQSGAAPGGGATGGQPPGSDSKPAIVPTGSHPPTGRPCHCAPCSEFILAKRELGLSARRIHQDLQLELGVRQVGYDSVRRFLKRVERVRPLPFRRMECEPGAEAQVDYGCHANGSRSFTKRSAR